MKRPSFLKKLKEQQRRAKADRKREERRARQRASRLPDAEGDGVPGDEGFEPLSPEEGAAEPVEESDEERPGTP